jgi:DsbC/DsbD-like thiol-disulfide interchange protein
MRRNDLLIFLVLILVFGATDWATQAWAQIGQGATFATCTATLDPKTVTPGGKAIVIVTVNVEKGIHINANQPGDENLIPTVLQFTTPSKTSGVVLGKPIYPTPKAMPNIMGSGTMYVYEGKVQIKVPVTVSKSAKGSARLTGKLRTQGCNETTCFPPITFPLEVPVTIEGGK